jgi:phosphatidate phosphatase LPIN
MLATREKILNLSGDQNDGSTERSQSPPPVPTKEAIERAISLSKQLAVASIPSHVTETGDLMLDMTGYKSSDDDALRAEVIARKILSEELEGNYDIGALIGADEQGNLWIYSSEEAKEAAVRRAALAGVVKPGMLTSDAASDPGYQSDNSVRSDSTAIIGTNQHRRADSDNFLTPPHTPPEGNAAVGDPNRNYAKTLRLTSDQLKSLDLKAGSNKMSFTVNRATCTAYMYLWRHDVPIVISDIDGTITKSDALGHVLNMIGRDWTHIGVAKLYTEIVANGYNIMYLTSRSVGQADTTRSYLAGVVQEGYKLPAGPTIMSPDRTIAALRREIYLRKPEVFKMACLRDIKNLYGPDKKPFYAGFGNRLTDALSYRSVSIPSNRIFTINSYAEVSLDLLSLNKLRLSYVNMREVVDHYFPPVSLLLHGEQEEFTDFRYWREDVLDLSEFSDSDEDEDARPAAESEDEGDEEVGDMGDSYISHGGESIDEQSLLEQDDDEEGDSEEEYDEEDEEDEISVLTQSLTNASIALSIEQDGEGVSEEDEDEDEDEEEEGEAEESSSSDDDGDADAREREQTPHVADDSLNLKRYDSRDVMEDHDAEIITGMNDLSVINDHTGPSKSRQASLDRQAGRDRSRSRGRN